MKKTFAICICALLLAGCASIPKSCHVTATGAYKSAFRVCLECDTTDKKFKAAVQADLEKQNSKNK